MLEIMERQTSEDGTRKYLLQLSDGNRIETVLMAHPYGNSVCVTSQAGCNMGCAFCASGLTKKLRDLTAEEMLAQVATVHSDLSQADSDGAFDGSAGISHIVVMGTGEPFDNYEEAVRFCDLISDERKLRALSEAALPVPLKAVAPRHITVSTCGLVPKILDFTQTEKRFNLAVSLHAPNNTLRDRLMPVNKKYPLEELIPAAAEYCRVTRRRITFEYLLLEGVNDSEDDARELAELLQSPFRSGENGDAPRAESADSFYVNLIPYNSVREFGFRGSDKETALRFYDVLMKHGVKATLRKERGADITAACGQLRLQTSEISHS